MFVVGDWFVDNLDQVLVVLIFCFNLKLMVIIDVGFDCLLVVGGGFVYLVIQNCFFVCCVEGFGCILMILFCFREVEVKEFFGIFEDWYICVVVLIGYFEFGGYGLIYCCFVLIMVFVDEWGLVWIGENL